MALTHIRRRVLPPLWLLGYNLAVILLWRKTRGRNRRIRRQLLIIAITAAATAWTILRYARRWVAVEIPESPNRRIIFGGTNALVIYGLGFMKVVVARHKDRLKRCSFQGISGGAFVAGYSAAAVHGVMDLDYWYYRHVRQIVDNASKRLFGFLFTSADVIRELGEAYYRICSEACGGMVPSFLRYGWYVPWVSDMLAFRSVPCKISCAESMGEAMRATSYIPFFIGATPWVSLSKARSSPIIWDGGFLVNTLVDTSVWDADLWPGRTVFFEFIQGGCPFPCDAPGIRNIKLWKVGGYTMSDILIWGDHKWADNLFEMGARDAERQMKDVDALIDFLDGAEEDSEAPNDVHAKAKKITKTWSLPISLADIG